MGLQPILEWFHSFQWELCHKHHGRVYSDAWCKRALSVFLVTVEPFLFTHCIVRIFAFHDHALRDIIFPMYLVVQSSTQVPPVVI